MKELKSQVRGIRRYTSHDVFSSGYEIYYDAKNGIVARACDGNVEWLLYVAPARRTTAVLSTGKKMKRAAICALMLLLIASLGGASASAQTLSPAAESPGVIHQLRIYELFDGNKKAFHERFRAHAMRIMARYDFKIVAIWESRKGDRMEFVYLLEWPDEATMNDRWTKFRADKEWIDIKKATGTAQGPLVGEIEDRTLKLADYSPRTKLAN
jgi:hypothetical protein